MPRGIMFLVAESRLFSSYAVNNPRKEDIILLYVGGL